MVAIGQAKSIQVGPEMEIVLRRGPLSDDWLRHIAQLYGSHDLRYSSVDFCRYQFNENPFGFSLHVFAIAGKDVVGHCAVIPVATRIAGEPRLTGKTESLFVSHAYRKFMVQHGDHQQTLAVTMVRHLYRFADEQGFSVIHSLGRAEFAKIHTAGGARIFEFPRRQWAFFLNVKAVRELLGDEVELIVAERIVREQRRLYQAEKARWQLLDAHREEIATTDLAKLDLTAFTALAVPHDHWTVAPAAETASWYLGSPAARRMHTSCGDQRCDFLYTAPGSGSWFEIFDWRCHGNSESLAVWALCRFIEDAEQEGRELVCFFDWTSYNPAAEVLQRAGEVLGFEMVETSRLIYLRSEDDEFSSVERMSFSPYFYATF
jgi:hypothetical protein